MCLSVAVHRPNDVLAKGVHKGLEWMVVHNGSGYRCGYVRLPKGHPWHGNVSCFNDHDLQVHGGITFNAPDEPCAKGGADDGFWIGFDCAHAGDAPDPELPSSRGSYYDSMMAGILSIGGGECVRSQEYVEAECRSLCEQVAKAGA